MKITFLTLHPEFYDCFLNSKVIQRAIQKNIVEIEVKNIRDYSNDKHKHVDDTPCGGGAGMVMRVDVVAEAIKQNCNPNSHIILTSPKGRVYNQKIAKEFSQLEHLVIICGHYEGVDHRITNYINEEVSIGDFVLTGGELASQTMGDSIIRLLKGAIKDESKVEESFENDLLEYPQYTRPIEYEGQIVPEVLLSGNHEKIRRYRLKESLKETLLKRKDLLEKRKFNSEEEELLKQIIEEN